PTIARYAKDNDVDLIIIGQRGVSSELEIMGSIARKLVNIAPTSCLVIK
ncbi:MAG TPA: universal stress protein, partial [Anaerolineae bacterium]|nr:universal stress protein [Anaerolineae bacterium]